MKKQKIITFFMVSIFFFGLISESHAIVTIKADNPNFQYTGRIDFTSPDKPIIYWPGTYIKANFEGSLLIVSLDDKTGQSFYDVYIDEDYLHPQVIDCSAGSKIYLISASLTDTVHSVLIFRRTEASTGPTTFLGIQINDGKTLVAPPARLGRKLLFYGDSITCGMGNEAPDSYADDNLAYENNFKAFGAVTSRLLNADYMCIAKSGIGIMISWFNMTMPQYYYRLDPDNASSNWDFSLYTPDVVVINLFQNDSWLLTTKDSTKITNAYVDFVRTIRLRHPKAFIVCSLGSMDITKTGSPWPKYVESAVKLLNEVDKDTNIGTYFFPFSTSWTKHPRVRHHLVMGNNLATYINSKMGWTTDIENNDYIEIPSELSLLQNYPNPFNPTTTIEYQIDRPGNIKIVIYDLLGREIRTLVNEFRNAGSYREKFNASDLSSGIYFYQLSNGRNIETKSMVLAK